MRCCLIQTARAVFFLTLASLFTASCTLFEAEDSDMPLTLKAASFKDLPGWGHDDLLTFTQAMAKSCARIERRAASDPLGKIEQAGTFGDWQVICRGLQKVNSRDPRDLQQYIESVLIPYEVRAGQEPEGLFTGYYEASLRGSLQKNGPYRYPLHKRPDDLVMVHLGEFRDHLKGERIAGRVINGTLKPYEERSEIMAGAWPHNEEVLVWVDDAVDAFFVQIQGSGVVQLDNGGIMRIGYAGQNGHPYYAIGRELIKRGALEKEDVSMQSIRSWLAANPELADEIMNTNRSYVFFRELDTEGPVGGEGVVLTAGRSLAIDHTKIPYGVPLWVDIEKPAPGITALRKLMMAQDTGGAIRGPVRGDVFWGYGDQAEELAGPMKAKGRYWVLLPKLLLALCS